MTENGHTTDDPTTPGGSAPGGIAVPDRVAVPDGEAVVADDGVDLPAEVEIPESLATGVEPADPDGILINFLDDLYAGQERVTQAEIHRRAVAAELPADVLIRINAMPEGEYAVDEAAELLVAREAG